MPWTLLFYLSNVAELCVNPMAEARGHVGAPEANFDAAHCGLAEASVRAP